MAGCTEECTGCTAMAARTRHSLKDVFCADTLSKQTWNEWTIVMVYFIQVVTMIALYFGGFMTLDSSSVGHYFQQTLKYVILLVTCFLVGLLLVPLRTGVNLETRFWVSALTPNIFMVLVLLIFWQTDPGRTDYRNTFQWGTFSSGCEMLCEGTLRQAGFFAVCIALGVIVFVNALITCKFILPQTLVMRHYNYRYVKELLSNRRSHLQSTTAWSILVQQGEAAASRHQQRGLPPSSQQQANNTGQSIAAGQQQCRLVSADSEVFTDVSSYVQRMHALGFTSEQIIFEIVSAQRVHSLNNGTSEECLRAGHLLLTDEQSTCF